MNIDDAKKSRAVLKSYFVKNAIPTEQQFAQLMDSMLSQRDDGVVRAAGDPLSIEAAGDNSSFKKALNFYNLLSDSDPAWTVSLRPRANPADPGTGRPGLSISDAAGNSRLTIDAATGRVGIGTVTPSEALEVNGRINVSGLTIGPWPANPKAYGFVGAASLNQAEEGNYALLQGTTGADVGTTYLNSPTAVHLRIKNTDRLVVTGNGNVGIGAVAPRARLEVAGGAIMPSWGNNESSGILFPPDPAGGAGDRAWVRYYPRSGESMTLEIGISNDPDDHIALMPSGGVAIGGNDAGGYRLNIAARGTDLWQNLLAIAGNTDIRAKKQLTLIRFGNSGDYQLLHNDKGYFSRNTLALHCEAGDALGFYSTGWAPLLEVQGGTGNAYIRGRLEIGTSDMYFTDPNHSHTGLGNTPGHAAIENAQNYNALMILGRTQANGIRLVDMWDNVTIHGTLNGHGADLAEMYISPAGLEPGDVVSLAPDRDEIVAAAVARDQGVIGVISARPGFVLNAKAQREDNTDGRVAYPVALCGRVACKVTDEAGPIRRGDLLTSASRPGYAMRAQTSDGIPPGSVVGKALGAHSSGTGVIDIFVMLH